MMFKTQPIVLPPYLWLAAFAASLLVIALYGCRFVRDGRYSRRVTNWLASLLAVVVVCAIAADGIVRHTGLATATSALRFTIAISIAAVLLGWVHLRLGGLALDCVDLRRTPLAWLALIAAVIASVGTGVRLHEIALAPTSDDPYQLLTPGARRELDRYVAVTDKGRRLVLYEWANADADFEVFSQKSDEVWLRTYPSIRREAASDQTNCHGWVFTKGRHLLFGTEVEHVLRDNGYERVEEPDVKDVIVYRAGDGTILHSGIVEAILADGSVLIESKWGISARYLHFPKDQPYGERFDYYHTKRRNHSVFVMSKPPARSLDANSASGNRSLASTNRFSFPYNAAMARQIPGQRPAFPAMSRQNPWTGFRPRGSFPGFRNPAGLQYRGKNDSFSLPTT